MTGWRPEFTAALDMFAAISQNMDAAGRLPPVLVGGAAVELYVGSAIASGDFDIITPAQEDFEALLRQHGFIKPVGRGKATRGWIHPALGLGFEVVGSSLMDGLADRNRVRIFSVASGDAFVVIAVEDLIADRMGQYASGTAPEMLEQARTLFALSEHLDMDYMEKRIGEETDGEYGVSDLQD